MFTIKLVEVRPEGTREQVYPSIANVEAYPCRSGYRKHSVTAWLRDEFHPLQFMQDGTIYVMNENGKTVATYELPSQEERAEHDASQPKAEPPTYPGV